MATVEIKYLTEPHDGTPGQPWEDFEERLLDIAAGRNDDRGWSLADCLNRVDEGSLGGPAMPGRRSRRAQKRNGSPTLTPQGVLFTRREARAGRMKPVCD